MDAIKLMDEKFSLLLIRRSLVQVQQGEPRKKPNVIALGFFQRCVPQAERDVSVGSDVRFAREVCLRHDVRNTLLHWKRSEQHHYA